MPDGMLNFGEVPGVAVNSKGHVFVFTRSNSASGPAYAPTAAQLLEFTEGDPRDRQGPLRLAIACASTRTTISGHRQGLDMIVVPTGRPRTGSGRRKESPDDAKLEHVNPPLPPIGVLFREPTDIAWDSKGNTYITDGYIDRGLPSSTCMANG